MLIKVYFCLEVRWSLMQIDKLTVADNNIINIVLSGVGGQGVLLASDIIVEVAVNFGFDAKKSEVHGMAQRGGSVVSQVRYGNKIYSPLIKKGSADIILAFEKLESIRYLDYIKPDGFVIFNNQQITPLTVFTSKIEYPQNIELLCKKKTQHVVPVNALEIAEKLGNLRVLNTIMLGVISNFIEFEPENWLKVISGRVPAKTVALNKQAFEQGCAFIQDIENLS